MNDRQLSLNVGERFIGCMDSIRSLYEEFLRESESSGGQAKADALVDTIRTSMMAAVAYFNRSGGTEFNNDELREFLHMLLEKAIDDYQFNERLHATKGD